MTTNQILGNENAANINKYIDQRKPRLSFYHPNLKGTGCAVTFAVTPATPGTGGCLEILFAKQKSVGSMHNGVGNLPTFDYENAGRTVLDFTEACQMLQVFRGEVESINDGKGLYERTSDGQNNTVYVFTSLCHRVDPICGYELTLTLNGADGQERAKHRIFLSCAESLGLAEALAGSMRELAFGR